MEILALFVLQGGLIAINVRQRQARLSLLAVILTFAATYLLPVGVGLVAPASLGGQTLFETSEVGLLFLRFLSAIVALVITLAPYYYQSSKDSFFVLAAGLVFAFSGLAFCVDWFTLLIFWEALTLIGYLLIVPSSPRIAKRYLVIHLTGAGLLFLTATRSTALLGTAALMPLSSELYPLAFVSMGFKVGLLGIHFWLPEAHGSAPAPASALLSGVMVKAGILGFHKVGLNGYTPMLWFGFGMILWGGWRALLERDLKRVLAYSTVSQLGYMLLATGSTAEVSMYVAAAYAFSHALAKSGLFLVAGLLEKQTGSRDLYHLRGASRRLPALFAVLLILTASLAGLPLTYGFISKGALKYILPTSAILSVGLHIGGLVTLLYMTRLHLCLWQGEGEGVAPLADWSLPKPIFIFALLALVLGIFPVWPVDLASGALGISGSYALAKVLDILWPITLAAVLTPLIGRLPLERIRLSLDESFTNCQTVLLQAGTGAVNRLRALHTGDLGDYLLYLFVSLCALLAYGYWQLA